MTNQTTKRALLTSVMSLIICIVMLMGTTFAWFTDSVTSGRNTITAGNLDIGLEYSKDLVSWDSVDTDDRLFDDSALWEPGHTEVVYLRVTNLGTLALKYQLSMNTYAQTVGKSVLGNDIYLSQHLMFGVTDAPTAKYQSREAAIEAVAAGAKQLEGYTDLGELEKQGDSKTVALVVYMPTTVGNEANYRGDVIPAIELGVELFATQYTYEGDSFGIDYDAGAYLPTVTTAEELIAALSADEDVTLGANIDVSEALTAPVASYTHTLDGNGYTVSGLKMNLFGSIEDATVKNINFIADIDTGDSADEIAVIAEKSYGNVTVDNTTVSGTVKVYQGSAFIRKVESGHTVITNSTQNANVTSYAQKAAGFVCTVGTADVTISNCVNNGNITADAARAASGEVYAGGFLAWNSNGKGTTTTLENCVNNGTITGIRRVTGSSTVAVGGISAIAWGGFTTSLVNVTNNGAIIADNTLSDHNVHAGGIIGMVNPNAIVNINGATNNASVSGSITNADNTKGVGNVGAIIGQLNNGNVTMVQLTVTDSSAITAATNAASNNVGALVGNAAGSSKVTYDTETVTYGGTLPHIGNKASGVTVTEVPSTAAQLASALAAGGSVVLGDDMVLEGWTAVGTETAPFTGSFNGNGYTVSGISGANGLFGYVNGATVENVTLEVAMDGAPALAYEILGGAADPTVISDVTINGSVKNAPAALVKNIRTTAANTSTDVEVTIKSCTNNADVVSENINRASGFVSTVFGANLVIDSCVNNGDMSVVSTTEAHAAGIAGYIMRNTATTMPTLKITNCINTGDITGKSTIDGRANVGGIVATSHQGTTTIENCANYGDVSGEEAANKNQTCVGGIVGRVNTATDINGCHNSGNITATATSDKAYAGGIVGMRNNDSTALNIDAATASSGTVTSNGTAVDKQIGNL